MDEGKRAEIKIVNAEFLKIAREIKMNENP